MTSPHHKEKECECKNLICGQMGNGVECSCHCHKEKEELKAILGEHAVIDYERNHSHYHCWHQSQPPACGIPLGKHIRCCLCDAPIPVEGWEGGGAPGWAYCDHGVANGLTSHCVKCCDSRQSTTAEKWIKDLSDLYCKKLGHINFDELVGFIHQLLLSERQAYKDSLREKVEVWASGYRDTTKFPNGPALFVAKVINDEADKLIKIIKG